MTSGAPAASLLWRAFGLIPIVASLAVLIDFAAGAQAISVASLIHAVGLGVLLGAFAGAATATLWRGLYERAPRMAAVAWATVGLACGAWLVVDLGVIARLGGKDHAAALAALGGAAVSAAGVCGLGLSMQPRPGRLHGYVGTWQGRRKHAAVLACLIGIASAIVLDRAVEPAVYRSAHLVLRWLSLAMGVLALDIGVAHWGIPPRLPRRLIFTAALLISASTLATLGEEDELELQAMIRRPFPNLALGTLRALTDFDLDGYGFVLAGGDCEPFDPRVHPGMAEILGNGVDDNCQLGDAPFRPMDDYAVAPASEPPPVSVVVVTIDTVRPDRMSLYGAARATTPNLDAWAKEATVFENAYTSGGWTSLALTSLFRGVYPRRMQWTRLYETNKYRLVRSEEISELTDGEFVRLGFGLPLEDPRPTLSALLRDRGMHTIAVVDGGYTQFLAKEIGAFPGFDEYRETKRLRRKRRNDRGTSDLAIRALRNLETDRRFFMWVHYFGPHDPSTTHDDAEGWGDELVDRYDHELSFMDQEIGRFLAAIDERPDSEHIAVIIASDHGEVFGSTRRFHGLTLGEDATRIPLLARIPELSPGRSGVLVSLVDIFPTVLALTRTPGPTGLDGDDLRHLVSPEGVGDGRILLTETWRQAANGSLTVDLVAAFDGAHKLVVDRRNRSRSLVRQSDAREANVIEEVESRALEQLLLEYLEENTTPTFVD